MHIYYIWIIVIVFYYPIILSFSFLKYFIYLFLESRMEGEREGEKRQYVVASPVPHTGDLAHNPPMCPDWESNPATLWFTGQHSIHWATPARAILLFSYCFLLLSNTEQKFWKIEKPFWHTHFSIFLNVYRSIFFLSTKMVYCSLFSRLIMIMDVFPYYYFSVIKILMAI